MAEHELIRWDIEGDALSIRLRDGIVVQTREIDSGTLVDLDASGRLVSIEVIRPGRAWPLETIIADYEIDADRVATLRSLWGGSENGGAPYRYGRTLVAA